MEISEVIQIGWHEREREERSFFGNMNGNWSGAQILPLALIKQNFKDFFILSGWADVINF